MGLSATLPNYIDVADFLGVNRRVGLFYFDSSFRPVPLEQHFIGVRGKPGSPQSRKNLDRVSFEKVSEMVREGHQVMVFVHARKETVKTALALKEAAMVEGSIDEYSCEDHPQYAFFKRDIGQSRNKEMKELFNSGFGIHHAGMLRTDRNMMERMFEARAIKVRFSCRAPRYLTDCVSGSLLHSYACVGSKFACTCRSVVLTSYLCLYSHTTIVIIKGTQVYDSAKGSFTDLSVLDVLQVFGRAGRPGLETSGVGFICTTQDKLDHYLDAVTSQVSTLLRNSSPKIDGRSRILSSLGEHITCNLSLTHSLNNPAKIRCRHRGLSQCRDCARHCGQCARCGTVAWLHVYVRPHEEESAPIRYVAC